MRKRSKPGGHGLFVRLLIPNMLFLLLPLLVGWVIYNQTLQVIEREATAANLKMLEQSRDILDRRFSEIASISQQLANDTRIMQFQGIKEPFAGANTYRILDTRKSFYNFSLSNNFIFNYFIVFYNSGIVMADSTTYKLDEFQRVFRYAETARETRRMLFAGSEYHYRKVSPAEEVQVAGAPYSLVTHIQSLGFPGSPQGAVAITVDNREIQKLLRGLDLSGGGFAYILNEEGETVSSSSSGERALRLDPTLFSGRQGSVLQRVGGREMMITYTTSEYNDWTYVAAQPADVVLEKVLYIKKITFAMAFLFLALGLAIAYVIAYRNSRPLRTILETIAERTDRKEYAGADAYRFIRDSVAQLIDNNRRMQEKMEQQAPLLRAALFERLLKGEYVPSGDIPVLTEHAGIPAQGERFAVVLLQLRGYDSGLDRDALEELDRKRVMVTDIVRMEIGESAYWHNLAEDQLAVLFAFGSGEETERADERLEDAASRVIEAIRSRLNIAARCGIGGAHEGLASISRSCEEARRALEYLSWGGEDGIMRFGDLPAANDAYYYPADLELRLGNLAKAGDLAAAEALLEELHRVNFAERRLSLPMLRLFMSEMWGTVVKLLPQVGMDAGDAIGKMPLAFGETAGKYGMEQSFRSIAAVYRDICGFVNEHKKSQNVELLGRIVRLLNDRYGDNTLCLDSVAERMNISKGYLSQFFREQTGVNFSDYLEDLRMAEAKKLLATTELPVFEIAAKVGYSSSNTFCRAFKRINGVSTTDFRRLQR